MHATDEELALKEQVAKTLETQGVLAKIKAELRAAVFQAIHVSNKDNDRSRSLGKCNPDNEDDDAIAGYGDDGSVALELVCNLLECLEMEHTLSVFHAEARLDTRKREWQAPSKLCEYMSVSYEKEETPILVQAIRQWRKGEPRRNEEEARSAPSAWAYKEPMKVDVVREVVTSRQEELPPLPRVSAPVVTTEEEDGELEASLAEEIASGSFEEESFVDEASTSHDNGATVNFSVAATRKINTHEEEEENEDEDEDEEPVVASPPPVPTKLGALPSLPGMTAVTEKSVVNQEEEGDDEGEEEEEAFDEEAEAERLHSLDAKLRAMEAEDDTGILQQLKASLQVDLQPDNDEEAEKGSTKHDEEEEGYDDNYGSDFEEEVEEEVQSEVSEDMASISALSESEDIHPKATTAALANDMAVESEDALNSYDYIEPVERM
ncbi:hypothetical protein Poli38472_000676 [Pythium oligandrum]|uniref:LisH domain-containing protein n=1 Tax=Pythium oligandrum TaxID=41045 RepID=A0A8K1CCQ6_PYTOL|nr:hypothetical protein Poli38472_000676 [Pythium oligandrum]|eukprot:TMW60634.1 hypothetical protein Poli38472_000676 [Pythium oligandrum]